MVEPNTSNIGLIVPNDGDLPGTWGSAAINPDMVAIDGLFGGVTTISLGSSNVTLTSPSGTISATAGPNQSQNAVIKLTGVLSANVQITLPLPGVQRVFNYTTGNFVVTLRAVGSGAIVGIPQGTGTNVFNDGTNVYLMLGGEIGETKFMSGVSAAPSWIASCTTKPWLICDGSIYNISDYPYLGNILLAKFGGNGLTTFAVPDASGRALLQYDFSGTRITSAGSGINGQVIGASGEMPSHTHSASVTDPGHQHPVLGSGNTGSGPFVTILGTSPSINAGLAATSTTGVTVSNSNTGGDGAHRNVQPSLIGGIWMIRAA